MNEVQAMILNLSFPHSLEELKEMVLASEELTIDTLLSYDKKEAVDTWPTPNWIKPDDIIFFMYTIIRSSILIVNTSPLMGLYLQKGV